MLNRGITVGDGSKVLMLAHVSPCEEDVAETVCSLSFATRARAVESIREIPEVRSFEYILPDIGEDSKSSQTSLPVNAS